MREANTEHLDMHCQALAKPHSSTWLCQRELCRVGLEPSAESAWEKLPGKGKGELGHDQGAQQLLPQHCKTPRAGGEEQGE